MDSIQTLWRDWPQETLLGLLLAVTVLLLWQLFVGSRQRQQALQLQQQLERMATAQQVQLSDTRQELLDSENQGQTRAQQALHSSISGLQHQILEDAGSLKTDLIGRFQHLQTATTAELAGQRESFEKRQSDALRVQNEALTAGMDRVSVQLRESLQASTRELTQRVEKLTETTDARLKEITGQVEKRLSEGFQKTTETFGKVLEHLSRIDEAQKRITELSTNVVSLQEVLTDKRARGAFGEVQMAGIIRNVLPEESFSLQQTLSNGKRVDCLLYLPEPTGNVAVDAKFPLESFRNMSNPELPELERAQATRQFREDIKKHIGDIASKYIIPGETADGAIMFLPAEAVFAEIHARFPDLIEVAQRQRVWLVSPTTMMAILTTARAVIKDEATRRQVHIIQDHLRFLSADFGRFQKRMDKLSLHIRQAHEDVEQVHTSAKKISGRFEKIERVELDDMPSVEETTAVGLTEETDAI